MSVCSKCVTDRSWHDDDVPAEDADRQAGGQTVPNSEEDYYSKADIIREGDVFHHFELHLLDSPCQPSFSHTIH